MADDDNKVDDISEALDAFDDNYMQEYVAIEHERKHKKRNRNIAVGFVVLLSIGGFGALIKMSKKFGQQPINISTLELIKADPAPYKEKPANPGGIKIDNQDKSVYEAIASQKDSLPKVVHIAPPPEEPLKREQIDKIIERQKKIDAEIAKKQQKKRSKQEVKKNIDITKTAKEILQEKVAAIDKKKNLKSVKSIPKPVAKTAPVKRNLQKEDITVVDTKSKLSVSNEQFKYKIQMGAFKSKNDAIKAWKRIFSNNRNSLSGLKYFIERANLADKGVFYRLQAGSFKNEADARGVCDKLRSNNQGCFFVR